MRIFAIFAVIAHLSSGWDCDKRCPGYEECMQQNRNLGGVSSKPDLSLLEDKMPPPDQEAPKVLVKQQRQHPSNHLRGSTLNDNSDAYRQLVHTTVNFTYFSLKMYWEEGYCWQDEWDEKDWCMECSNCKKWAEGNVCDETGGSSKCSAGDYLWTKRCDKNEDEQQFIYEAIPEMGGGRIHPYHAQNLCWERTRVNAHQLRPCSPINAINSTQIIIGFQESGRFELHPYGWDENTTLSENGPKCLNNHHHPKDDEIVRAEFCNFSRKNKISRWIVHNPVLVTGGSGGSNQGGGDDGDPEVQPEGGNYCTPDSPCQQCYGDCDDDEDCIGHLVCFERDGGDPVPSCSGGEDSDSDTDYCVDPFWTSGQGSSPPPPTPPPSDSATPAPTTSPTRPPTSAPTEAAQMWTASPTAVATTATPTAGTATTPPTVSPTTATTPAPPSTLPEVEAVNGSFCTPDAPCPICWGDCDYNIDCQGDLVCFKREPLQPVPGCSGGEGSTSSTDYCVDPNAISGTDSSTTPAPVAPSPTNPPVASPTPLPAISYATCSPTSPCEKCVGDCDQDSDCAGSLVCPDRSGGEPIPGCSGTDISKTDFCVEP